LKAKNNSKNFNFVSHLIRSHLLSLIKRHVNEDEIIYDCAKILHCVKKFLFIFECYSYVKCITCQALNERCNIHSDA